jgi:hypothetical protein
MEFVSIPDYILNKLKSGNITIAHFSDILRIVLLYEHGGIWMDATILVTGPFSFDSYSFFTLKSHLVKFDSITMTNWAGISSHKSKRKIESSCSNISRWSSFFWAGTRHGILFSYMKDFFYSYWEKQNEKIDYFFFDYEIAVGYDSIGQIKELIDAVPLSNENLYSLYEHLGMEYSDELFERFCSENTFHKLTIKKQYDMTAPDGKLTFYGFILKNYLEDVF